MKVLKGLNETLKDLDGAELKDNFDKSIPVKLLIAQTIRRGSNVNQQGGLKFDVMRAEEVAYKIYRADGKIELEDADYSMVKQIVNEDMLLNVMAKAACLGVLNSVRSEENVGRT